MTQTQWVRSEIENQGVYSGQTGNVTVPLNALTPEEIVFRNEERKARILFQSLQPEVYAEYEASEFKRIKTESSIFPVQYAVQRNKIYVYDSVGTWPIPRICIAPKHQYSNPDTDNVLQLYLMLKWNEEYVLWTGNWEAGYVSAWLVLCKKYPLHALRYYLLRLSQKVVAVLSFCTGGRR